LDGRIAVVAGATRGAGRGIAIELAAAGAKVYCTGRSTRGHPATPGRPETIEETAHLINSAGGRAVAVRVDHSVDREVEALAERLRADEQRLDILVNDVWGGDPLIQWDAKFWDLDMASVRTLVDQAILSHLTTARALAPLMVGADRGLIVEVTDGELPGYRGQLLYDLVKSTVSRLAYAMAWDLAQTGVVAVALSPGFLRSEAILEGMGVTEANWREAARAPAEFRFSESPRYIGRAVAALAADPDVARKSGLALGVGDLALEYGFTDVDGARPRFWRDVEAWIAPMIEADGKLDRKAVRLAGARYQASHLSAEHAELARAYARRLNLEGLGAGLLPISPPRPT
jgi:NAD(P)-dependent dehydrogenase (short-subunit alcohol dehydrogenase family)